ncbi:hypothetical protein D3C75_1082800 [compost metagenome]
MTTSKLIIDKVFKVLDSIKKTVEDRFYVPPAFLQKAPWQSIPMALMDDELEPVAPDHDFQLRQHR